MRGREPHVLRDLPVKLVPLFLIGAVVGAYAVWLNMSNGISRAIAGAFYE